MYTARPKKQFLFVFSLLRQYVFFAQGYGYVDEFPVIYIFHVLRKIESTEYLL